MKKFFSVLFLTIFVLTSFGLPSNSYAAERYSYKIYDKSPDASIKAGESIVLWTKIKNTGSEPWYLEGSSNPIRLGTSNPQDRASSFRYGEKWLSDNRIKATAKSYDIMEFGFHIQAPPYLAGGTYTECFYPVIEHTTWMHNEQICWNIHVEGDLNQYSAEGTKNYVTIDANKGDEKEIEFAVKNTGTATWYKYGSFPVHLATSNPNDRSSDFYHDSWLNYNRPAELNESIVAPGGTGHFTFKIDIPDYLTGKVYNEHFWLVAENNQWFIRGNVYPYPIDMIANINVLDYDNDNDEFSNKYSDIEASDDRIDADGNDEVTLEVELRDHNDDPIKYAWIDLIGKEIDVYDREEDYFDYTIKTDSEGRASYDFSTRTVADYEFTFSYEGEEYDDWVEFGSYDEDEDYNKDFSDEYSDIYINKDYIDSDGDEEARIDISIRDHDNNPIEDERFELIVLEREIDEDGWDEDSFKLKTNSRGEADKYFSTNHESDFEFTFELDGDRFRDWASLKSYEDGNDNDGDFDPDYSYIEVNRNRIKANDSDYALIEIGVNDKDDDPMEDQEVVIYGDRCDLDGRNCRNIDDIVVYTDNSGVAEYKFRYDREAEFELTYEVDGERSRQYVNFEFYEDDNYSDDYDINNDYEVPVLALSYIPVDRYDDVDIDVMKDWKDEDLDELRDYIDESNKDLMYYLEEGSTYHGYKDSGADPALDYYIVDEFEFLDELPESDKFTWGNTNDNMIDYFEILEDDIDVCDYVDNDGVKEVWIWGYAAEAGEPVGWESNMSMGRNIDGDWNYSTYGNVSNSYREKDMPICDNTYTAYTYNYGREVGMALEDHTHQIESVLNYVDGRDDTSSSNWDDLLFWGKFVGSDSSNEIVRPGCGWTHYPPNGEYDYDWHNQDEVWSDCEDWEPDGGHEELVSCETWGGSGCDKYEDDGQNVAFLVWWMQNIPGIDNDVYDGNDKIKNWWDFIGNFDDSIGDQSLTY